MDNAQPSDQSLDLLSLEPESSHNVVRLRPKRAAYLLLAGKIDMEAKLVVLGAVPLVFIPNTLMIPVKILENWRNSLYLGLTLPPTPQ